MSYRPQFATHPLQLGYQEVDFLYYFDETSVPDLGAAVAPGEQVLKIPLPFEKDAEYVWRAVQISGNAAPLAIRFYDPFGNELSSAVIEADRDYSGTVGGLNPVGRLPVMLEPEIVCPAGSVLLLDIANLS